MKISMNDYTKFKAGKVLGRYVVNEQIIAFLNENTVDCTKEILGYSTQNRPIIGATIGKGQKKILMWSQMHGNESTTTKAVLDLINLLSSDDSLAGQVKEKCTIMIIPILNPDGAEVYTRVNANQVDLNRDAQNRSEPESRVLREAYTIFEPHFCFNLHDQRTIYNVGVTSKPATVSFLAPAFDEERNVSGSRLLAMQLITAMNEELQRLIPGQIGRYDDAFNANCVGDTFQMLKTPTILFEAGHTYDDYERERTREYIFYAMVKAVETITSDTISGYDYRAYLDIPENDKCFFDILVKNVPLPNSSGRKDVGILFTEVLEDGKIIFIPKIEKDGDLTGFFGHETYDFLNSIDLRFLKNSKLTKLLGL